MPEVAFITGTLSSTRSNTPSANNFVRDSGGVAYVLRKADGTNLGTYQSVAQARAAFNASFGLQNIQRWERQDLGGDIEHHVCFGLPLNPKEIWGDSLITWFEPALVPGSVIFNNADLSTILQINDLSEAGNLLQQTVAIDQPTLTAGDNYVDRLVVDFGASQNFLPSSTLTALTPPYTIIAVASNRDPTGGGDLVDVIGAGDDLLLADDGATGAWQLSVAAIDITSATISSADPDIVVVQQRANGNLLRVNAVTDGTSLGVPDAGRLEAGGPNTDNWNGQLALLIVASSADEGDLTRIRQTERYAASRYPIVLPAA